MIRFLSILFFMGLSINGMNIKDIKEKLGKDVCVHDLQCLEESSSFSLNEIVAVKVNERFIYGLVWGSKHLKKDEIPVITSPSSGNVYKISQIRRINMDKIKKQK